MRDAAGALVDAYDVVILDLDGVVILGDTAVSGAPEALARLRAGGVAVRFATNNASRRRHEVARLLRGIGVDAAADEVLTSAAAAAAMMARRLPPGSPVLVVGADALREDVADAGLKVVSDADAGPAAVVQGYSPDVNWAQLAEACVAVRAGAWWVATNLDLTLPSPRGALPGNGSLVAVLSTALGRGPDLAVGKPEPALFQAAAGPGSRALVVGDRLDTDIAGANRAGLDSLLVLTGVAARDDAVTAQEGLRPTYLADDLSGLFTVGVEPAR